MASLLAAGALVGSLGCGDSSVSSPTPTTPSEPPAVPEVAGAVRGASEGETTVWLLDADPLPGTTLSGCGPGVSGCEDRIRLTFRLRSAVGGPTLGLRAYLHSDRAAACLRATHPSVVLAPGASQDVELTFQGADTQEVCPTPLELTHLAVMVEGPVQIAARQEWSLHYRLDP
jgi:hypothetical protein